jgi:hypothetical protein
MTTMGGESGRAQPQLCVNHVYPPTMLTVSLPTTTTIRNTIYVNVVENHRGALFELQKKILCAVIDKSDVRIEGLSTYLLLVLSYCHVATVHLSHFAALTLVLCGNGKITEGIFPQYKRRRSSYAYEASKTRNTEWLPSGEGSQTSTRDTPHAATLIGWLLMTSSSHSLMSPRG